MCIYVAFEGHIIYWHIYGYSMVINNCSLLLFLPACAVMYGLHVEYGVSAVENLC